MKKQDFILSSILGICFTFLIQYIYVKRNFIDFTSLLHTNSNWSIGKWIKNDFKDLEVVKHGHDTQFVYLIARAPLGVRNPDNSLNNEIYSNFIDVKYRYQRILLPLIAGGLGYFSPKTILWMLIILTALSFGIITWSFSFFIDYFGMNPLFLGAVFLHPGALNSMVLLTPDLFAFALSMLALIAFIKNKDKTTLILCMLLLLTKEVYLLVVVSIAILYLKRSSKFKSLFFLFLSSLPLILWHICLFYIFSDSLDKRIFSNLSFPFIGIIDSVSTWRFTPTKDKIESYYNLFLLLFCIPILYRIRKLDFFYIILPWFLLAICLSPWVWQFGNNSSRVLLPLWLGIYASFLFTFFNMNKGRAGQGLNLKHR